MQWPPAVVGDEIGDIDKRVDGAKPDCAHTARQPFRRGAIIHAANQAQSECGAKRWGRVEFEGDLGRAGKAARYGLDGTRLELAQFGRRKITRYAVHTGAIRTVRREVDLDDGIIQPRPARVTLAHKRIIWKLDDALVVIGDLQLEFRYQHPAA